MASIKEKAHKLIDNNIQWEKKREQLNVPWREDINGLSFIQFELSEADIEKIHLKLMIWFNHTIFTRFNRETKKLKAEHNEIDKWPKIGDR